MPDELASFVAHLQPVECPDVFGSLAHLFVRDRLHCRWPVFTGIQVQVARKRLCEFLQAGRWIDADARQ
jgi:hypothetical protein